MIDRLISGAGATTDGADRAVRSLAGGSRRGFTATGPGSLLVVAVLLLLSGMLVVAGLEATDPPTPVDLAPAAVATSRDLGNRTYSTINGAFSSTYAEYFSDDNGNGFEDEGEATLVWYYWLVDRDARAGVTVRSTRPPEALFTFHGSGVLIGTPDFARESFDDYEDDALRAGLTIEPGIVLDTTVPVAGRSTPLDLGEPLPPTATHVELTGARLGSYVGVCRHKPSQECFSDEADMFEVLVFDQASRHAIRVLVREIPEFTEEATVTGLLRREERAVDDARTGVASDFGYLDLDVSDRYVLDEAAAAGSAPLAFGLAGVLAALAGVILFGLAGGYLIYRRSERSLPLPATSLGPGERIPLRITGVLRTPTGLEHVREAPGDLIRFVLGRPVATTVEREAGAGVAADDLAGAAADASAGAAADALVGAAADASAVNTSVEPYALTDDRGTLAGELAGEPAATLGELGEPAATVEEPPMATTLIVERSDTPQGIAVGLVELSRLSSGQVMTLRAPRPALRVVAGTGPLFLSFDTEADRDRAAAELLDETGLGPDGKNTRTP